MIRLTLSLALPLILTASVSAQQGMAKLEPTAFDYFPRDLHAAATMTWAVKYSPDGKTLAVGRGGTGQRGELQLWDVEKNTLHALLHEPVGTHAIAFSGDGKTMATADYYTRTAKVRDGRTGRVRKVLTGHLDPVASVAVSFDGKLVATGCHGSEVGLWDTDTGALLHMLKGHTGAVYSVAFSPKDNTLASAGADSTVVVWNADTRKILHTLRGHKDVLQAVTFAPDGVTLASAGWDKIIRFWNTADGKATGALEGHKLNILALAFSSNGDKLASSAGRWFMPTAAPMPVNEVKVWNLKTMTEMASVPGHKSFVWSVAFSKDGDTLASGGWDPMTLLSDVAGKKQPIALKAPQPESAPRQPFVALAQSPDGASLAVAAEDRSIRILDADGGRQRFVLPGHADIASCLAYSPDSKLLASAGPDKLVMLWDTDTGKLRRTWKGHTSWINALAWAPDGKVLASAGFDKSIRLWKPTAGDEDIRLDGHSSAVTALLFANAGETLVSAGTDRVVRLWNVATRKQDAFWTAHDGAVRVLALAPDGKMLATAGDDLVIKLWELAGRKAPKLLAQTGAPGHTASITLLAFSAKGKTLASGDVDGQMFLWDTQTGRQRTKVYAHARGLSGLTFAGDGRDLVTVGYDFAIRRWQAGGELVRRFNGSQGPVQTAVFSKDGSRILSTGGWPKGDGTVRLWDTETGQLRSVAPPTSTPQGAGDRCVTFLPDGKRFLSAGQSGILFEWSIETGKEIRQYKGHEGTINAVACSTTRPFAATAGDDKTVRLWNLDDGKPGRVFKGHTDVIRGIAFSPDGKRLLSASRDKSLRIWDVDTGDSIRVIADNPGDVEGAVFFKDGKRALAATGNHLRLLDLDTGKELRRFDGSWYGQTCVALSPDERWALSGGYDTVVRLWDVKSGQEIRRYRNHANWIWSVAFSPDGRHALSAGGSTQVGNNFVNGSDFTIRLWALPVDSIPLP